MSGIRADQAPAAGPDSGRRRRVLGWLQLALQAALLLGILVVANLLARRSPARIDLTSRRTYVLSALTEELLRGLPCELVLWLNSDEYEAGGDKALRPALVRTRELLREFARRNPKIRSYDMSAQGVPERELFQQHWSVISPTTVYLLALRGTETPAKKMVGVYELFEGNAVTGEVTAYRGEPVLAQAIRDLVGGVRKIVYQTEGHQEYLTDDARALGYLAHYLTRNEGVELRRIRLIEYKSVPAECDVLMVMGPGQPFADHEIELLRDYLERGGSLLVALRPRVRSGLEAFLEEYGVKPADAVVLDGMEYFPPRRTDLAVRQFNVHEINRSLVTMANVTFRLPDCAPVDPVDKRDPAWTILPLVRSGPASWEEKGPMGPGVNPKPDPPEERVGNLPLVVAVEKPASKNPGKRAKLVVWGSVAPFTNAVLNAGGLPQELQVQYVANHFRWLAHREMVGIDPQKISVKPLEMSAEALARLRWVVLAGFPAFGVALGVLVWFLRRT
jgi:hypothetical protein